MMKQKWIIYVLLIIPGCNSLKAPTCTYGGRGSLSSTCYNANPAFFKKTSYRFDNLDETVKCVNCSLEVIESGTFDISGNQIKHLDLEHSLITVLKAKSFMGLVYVRKLNLKKNNIVSIPPDTFQGVTKVEDLNVESNSITSLLQNGFKELTNLKKLNLKDNRIKTIENGSFTGLTSLEDLNLANNDIFNIANIFLGLENICLINLEGNKIVDIVPMEIKQLNALLELTLAKNMLKTIVKDTFLSLPRLETLNLSSNPIETIEMGGFRGLDSLEVLDLSNCFIENIKKGLLLALHQLRVLNLSFNKLTVFQTGTFSGLPELRYLNMSHNKVEMYEKTGIFPLHSLHILDLSYNNLKDLDYKMLVNHLPSLSHIGLEYNPWPCYLKKEMEELFRHDNLIFDLGPVEEVPKSKCNDSRSKIVDVPVEEAYVAPSQSQPVYVSSSNGHEYVFYVFMVVSLLLMACLFYLQHRNKREIGDIVGRSNISETRLISSALEDTY